MIGLFLSKQRDVLSTVLALCHKEWIRSDKGLTFEMNVSTRISLW